MRNSTIIISIIGLFCLAKIDAQEVPNLIPPSPEAISFIQYGNSSVNYYSGQPDLNIPIYTINSRGYQMPISLSYNSFQGINVESIAPWVGLGWSLNAGGSVSRVVRGKADDELQGYGYLDLVLPEYTDTSSTNDHLVYKRYGDGEFDGEPDKFFFNVNGMSGEFYVQRDGSRLWTVQKPKSNIQISFDNTRPISSFSIIGTDGMKYEFDAKEYTQSYSLGQSINDAPNPVTSWYLTRVIDQAGDTLVSISYYEFNELIHATFAPGKEKEGESAFLSSDMAYTFNNTSAKRIKEVKYHNGKVKFNRSIAKRQDYRNDYYLDNIEIYNGSDSLIKRFKLNYSYFDDGTIVPIDVAESGIEFNGFLVGDFKKRLKLDSIQEWSNDLMTSLPPYTFEYNLNEYLPSRYTLAEDHWGFYNGALQNLIPEPLTKFVYTSIDYVPRYAFVGSANREVDHYYAKAGVLKKVTYPTGGYTEFEMEGNFVQAPKLNNPLQAMGPIAIPVREVGQDTAVYFNVNLINDAFVPLTISGTLSEVSQYCTVYGELFKSGAGTPLAVFTMLPQTGANSHHSFLIPGVKEAGTYYVRLIFETNCTTAQPNDVLQLYFSHEIPTINKKVGGLRVKSITDHDGISSANDVIRNFYYNEEGQTGNSTGRLVNIPRYAYQSYGEVYDVVDGNTIWSSYPEGLVRTINPKYPLLTTNGSFVGYGKVTVVQHNGTETGKTEFEFSTSDFAPDFIDSYVHSPLAGEGAFMHSAFQPAPDQIFPFPQIDERDYLRGKLLKQANFKWNGSGFTLLNETINTYGFTFAPPSTNGLEFTDPIIDWQSFNVSVNTGFEKVNGLKAKTYYSQNDPEVWTKIKMKRYNIYSARFDLIQSVSRQYDTSDSTEYIESISINHWDDLEDNYFNVSRTQVVDSKGDTLETKYFYVYDSLSWVPNGITSSLMDRNMISSVLQQESWDKAVKLSTLRNMYTESISDYLPSSILTAKGENDLEARVRYHKYDSVGNPLVVSQESGMLSIYVWGYNKSLPVAKIDNATFEQVESALGSFDLGAAGLSTTQEGNLRSITGAMVTTIDYHPGLGMKSQTDPNGRTSSFEYDSFGRLIIVRDNEGKIVQRYNYHFKGQ